MYNTGYNGSSLNANLLRAIQLERGLKNRNSTRARFEKYSLLDFLITFKDGVRFNEYKFWIATKNIWIASKEFVLLPKTFVLIQTVFLRMISYTLQNLAKTHSFFWCEEFTAFKFWI